MRKNQNTFAKRQREMNKKRKAEDKRTRRQRRKEREQADVAAPPELVDIIAPETASLRD